jgi:hypothetical protein
MELLDNFSYFSKHCMKLFLDTLKFDPKDCYNIFVSLRLVLCALFIIVSFLYLLVNKILPLVM